MMLALSGWGDMMVSILATIPTRMTIEEIMKNDIYCKSLLKVKLLQHLLLYLALFCSIMATIFSIQTHVSTDFAILSKPIDISIFTKNVSSIGLSSWEVCGLKPNIVYEIQYGDIDSVLSHTFDDLERALYLSRFSTTTEDTGTYVDDEWYWDDGLMSADFPYRDDDAVLNEMPSDYWFCQTIRFSSYDVDDRKWILSRAFLLIGTLFGVTAACFLVVLIVSRVRRVNGKIKQARQLYKCHCYTAKKNREQELYLRSLDTASGGYRSVASLFMVSYLFQCCTLMFFDSDLCKRHGCQISSGASSLLAACIFWVISGVLVYSMMRKILKNQKLVRTYKNEQQMASDKLKTVNQSASTLETGGQDVDNSSSSSPINQLNDTIDTDVNDLSSLGINDTSNDNDASSLSATIDSDDIVISFGSSFDGTTSDSSLGSLDTETGSVDVIEVHSDSFYTKEDTGDIQYFSTPILSNRNPFEGIHTTNSTGAELEDTQMDVSDIQSSSESQYLQDQACSSDDHTGYGGAVEATSNAELSSST
eukprot:scaffold101191_cov85-Cyclotella_meneghiniana.AAC.2